MFKIYFAPLQGYTDWVYREAHARFFAGVDAYYTPFVRLEKGRFRKKDLKDIVSAMHAHQVPQLIAANQDEFRKIACEFRRCGYKEMDINLGCPFPKQVHRRRGAGILPYVDEVERLLHTTEEFPDTNFSVKLRLGWESMDEAFALLPLFRRFSLKQVVMHPRLGKQQYKGNVNMEAFARFYEACDLPLIYNGDLNSLDDILSLESCFPKLDGVMLGRGLLANPWLAEEYKTGMNLSRCECLRRVFDFHTFLMEEYAKRLDGGDHQVLGKMKTLWEYLLPDSDKKLRKRILKSTTLSAYQLATQTLLNP